MTMDDDSATAARHEAFDLSATYVHLGLGARATPLPDFEWTPEYLEAYGRRFADDGREGRLVTMGRSAESWTTWERHPAGEEVVVLLSGRMDLIQRTDGAERRIPLRPGQAVVNRTGVWHTVDVHEPGDALLITPGQGTEHEPRTE
jgi:mannose-6-phosphate isomerase-like protein (cupin superfamily)